MSVFPVIYIFSGVCFSVIYGNLHLETFITFVIAHPCLGPLAARGTAFFLFSKLDQFARGQVFIEKEKKMKPRSLSKAISFSY